MGETPAANPAASPVAVAERRILAGERFVRCDLDASVASDLDLVDRLARLRLDARRYRCRLEIRTTDPQLRELLALAGLDGVVLDQR
jgi:hypothetical protein